MSQESVIGIIELSSIIIAGGLGIAGAVTETKDTRGRLTKWGIIAVVGIIISNSFSFIQSYLKQQQDAYDQIANFKKEQIKDSIERAKYQQQLGLLYANIYKSDSSLKQQFRIQSQTSDVLSQVDKSIDVQNSIFKQSEVLNDQQLKAAEKIDRTLNPLFPFTVDVTLKVRMDSVSKELSLITQVLQNNLKALEGTSLFKSGFLEIENNEGKFIGITAQSRDYASFISMLVRQDVALSFSKMIGGVKQELVCELELGFLRDETKKDKNEAIILYNEKNSLYVISIRNVPVKVTSNTGRGFNSTKDLDNTNFKFTIGDAPGFVTNFLVNFKFPPDFSKFSSIRNSGSGTNKPNQRTYSYNYSTKNIELIY
jgi:hypothetical protein